MISSENETQKRMIINGIVRELDQFTNHLVQIEKDVAQLISSANGAIPPQVATSLQSVDHMVQVCTSLGLVLSHLNDSSDLALSEVLATLTPEDLAQRLSQAATEADQSKPRFEYF